MSSLQQEVLDAIGLEGVPRKSLREKVGNVGENELDVAVNALLRARRVTFLDGRLKVIPSTRLLGSLPHTGRPPAASDELASPTAQEEAAASLRSDANKKKTCEECQIDKDEGNFAVRHSKPTKICKSCMRKLIAAGKEAKQGRALAAADSTTAKAIPKQPVIADRAFELARTKRQAALNRIQIIQVDLANQQSIVQECDQFLELYQRFAAGAA